MLKCGPVHSKDERAPSERPIHSPLRVPTITTVSVMTGVLLGLDDG
jgi:hypothetical protein